MHFLLLYFNLRVIHYFLLFIYWIYIFISYILIDSIYILFTLLYSLPINAILYLINALDCRLLLILAFIQILFIYTYY